MIVFFNSVLILMIVFFNKKKTVFKQSFIFYGHFIEIVLTIFFNSKKQSFWKGKYLWQDCFFRSGPTVRCVEAHTDTKRDKKGKKWKSYPTTRKMNQHADTLADSKCSL